MKYPFLIAAALVFAMGACKTPYRATDQPQGTVDSTSSAVDTSASMKTAPPVTDTSMEARLDSTEMDTLTQDLPDSSKINSQRDTAMAKPLQDTATVSTQPNPSPTSSDSAAAAVKTPGIGDSAQTKSITPAVAEPAFTKQYPGANNTVWSAYDSLAAIPIDMRLTGWKKMSSTDHMVKFDFNDATHYAWYDSEGKWIGSATPMEDVNKLPAAVKTAVNNAIKTRYDGYAVSQVVQEAQPGKRAYEVELTKDENKVRMLVSSAGKINQIYRYKSDKQ